MSKQSRARAAAKVTGDSLPPTTSHVLWVRRGTLLAGGIIVLAALLAYCNSFSGSFIFDDSLAITDNPSIRHLGSALSPPPAATTGGRPLLNFTFALNHALGGMNVWGYHAFNLLIHTLAGLTLFGVVRCTLRKCPTSNILLRQGFGGQVQRPTSKLDQGTISPAPSLAKDATLLALTVAVIWVVHPIQTESVAYISQRAESLMGLFYLLTLYFFIHGTDETGKRREARGERPEKETRDPEVIRPPASSLWSLASIFSCFLGTLSKEVIVTAPVMVLLYDRTFVAGSFCEAWRRRWRYYLGLACSWLLLAHLMTGLSQRSVGFDRGITWWSYALTSCRSVVLYLRMAIWPHPLVFDYGTDVVHQATAVLPYALVLVFLAAGLAIALWRWPAVGFVGAWFFIILAPTSSVVPIALQPMGEHRMYLPLAAVVVLGVLGLYRWIGRRSLIVFAAVATGLGCATFQRNNDYRNAVAIWNDTAAKAPGNARAHNNLGLALLWIPGRLPDAITECQAALRLNPDYAEAHNNLGLALSQIPGRLPDAIAEFEAALRLKPADPEMHSNLGNALSEVPGRLQDAIAEYQAALRIEPDNAGVHSNLGNALSQLPGRLPDAIAEYQAALRVKPDYAKAHYNLGHAFAQIPGHLSDAMVEYETALRINPGFVDAHCGLGLLLSQLPGRRLDATAQYEAALRINPDSIQAQQALEQLRANQ